MSDDLADLYQEMVLDHGKRPRNRRRIPGAHRSAEGFNPLCGDRVVVDLLLAADAPVIRDVAFEGSGCAVCMASASMMTEAVRGRSIENAVALAGRFRESLVQNQPMRADDDERLRSLQGVRRFPMRVKCATLPWHALTAAVRGEDSRVSTE
jgi:nitrogen fixation NifU-like protein